MTSAITDILFAAEGMPNDELSISALSHRDVRLENPVHTETSIAQQVLGDLHTEVMSDSTPIDVAARAAEQRFAQGNYSGS